MKDDRPPGVVRIFDMGLELLDDKRELLLALEASTTNLRTVADLIEDEQLSGLIRANCEANERTLNKVRGAPKRYMPPK